MPMAYTGEAGIDYLFRQTGSSFPVDVNAAIDEGFEDLAEDEVTVVVQEVDSTPVELPTEDDLDIKVRYRLGVCACTCILCSVSLQHSVSTHFSIILTRLLVCVMQE